MDYRNVPGHGTRDRMCWSLKLPTSLAGGGDSSLCLTRRCSPARSKGSVPPPCCRRAAGTTRERFLGGRSRLWRGRSLVQGRIRCPGCRGAAKGGASRSHLNDGRASCWESRTTCFALASSISIGGLRMKRPKSICRRYPTRTGRSSSPAPSFTGALAIISTGRVSECGVPSFDSAACRPGREANSTTLGAKPKRPAASWGGEVSPRTPPGRGEVEVSVFGPGYGECILIHAGDGDWIIVDSCIDVATRQAVAVDYLSRIGVDPSRAVRLVVATHWHDDHVRGMAATVDACQDARFVCSDALNTREFLTLLKAFASRPMAVNGSGLQELDGVVRLLETRARDGSGRDCSPIWAAADRPLWRRGAGKSSSGLQADVHSLSPSDASILAERLELQSLWPAERRPKRRLIGLTPNLAAVVLWVTAGRQKILLGADLEETTNPHRGWTAILDSPTRPLGVATTFKVAHHGSANADHPRIWRELLAGKPTAVLTPFRRSGRKLPTTADIRRITARTSSAYITAPTELARTRRSPTVQRMLRRSVRSVEPVHGPMGHVRLRANGSEEGGWRVELFGAAMSLSDLAA